MVLIATLSISDTQSNTECCIFIVMLSAFTLRVTMPSVIILSVVILSIVMLMHVIPIFNMLYLAMVNVVMLFVVVPDIFQHHLLKDN